MPWPCFIVENQAQGGRTGAMWPVFALWDGKTYWLVRLPNGGIHNIHGNSSDGTPWQVTGEAPRFSVSPSINRLETKREDGTLWRKGWHGYLTDGVLTDDYEGRTY